MNILEKELETLLWESLNKNPQLLIDRGLSIRKDCTYVRQPDLGSYGRPDIVGYTIGKKEGNYRTIDVSIFELKKDQINSNTLNQACRYITGIKQYMKMLRLSTYANFHVVLLGKSLDTTGDFVFSLDRLHGIEAYTYKIDLVNGMSFDRHSGYTQNNPAFPKPNFRFSQLKELCENNNYHILARELFKEDAF